MSVGLMQSTHTRLHKDCVCLCVWLFHKWLVPVTQPKAPLSSVSNRFNCCYSVCVAGQMDPDNDTGMTLLPHTKVRGTGRRRDRRKDSGGNRGTDRPQSLLLLVQPS